LPPSEISKITKAFYRAFGQNFMEIFFIPLINKEYIKKYISIEGLEYIHQSFKRGKGVILLGMHEGSWELSNIICANLGFPFSLFIREQRHPRLNRLLNLYRSQKGCKLIQRQNQLRQLIQLLKNNEAIGMTADQGGRSGLGVKFLGKEASMPQGAIKLALKYGVALIPAFYTRIKGPYVKIIVEPPFEVKRTGDIEVDIRENLQRLVCVFEKNILKYPQEYLWTYKIWKYGKEKNILILSDGKTGHLRQSETLGRIISDYFKNKDKRTNIEIQEIKFRNKFQKYALTLSTCLAGKYRCQGCLWCLRRFLQDETYKSLISIKPDIIISCGSGVALLNFILSRENFAKSIVIMRPSVLSTRRFDLVVMPQHDRPPKRENVVVTEGALNLIDEDYLRKQSESLIRDTGYRLQATGMRIGLLIGGDTKYFHLDMDKISEVIKQIKSASERWSADILVTTSRRTSLEVEKVIKEEFKDYSRCKVLVIANERNFPFAVGGILGLSHIVITSSESISMISEAASSNKYAVVFNSKGLSKKHRRFLGFLTENKYIYLTESCDLSKTIEYIWQNKPQIRTLRDNFLVAEAIKKIL
jgi:KDO2-lipid IV(A) lauroyltransferase